MTRRLAEADYLQALGAAHVVSLDALNQADPSDWEQWAAAIDCLGGHVLAHLVAEIRHRGALSSVGMVVTDRCELSLACFNERAISVLGVDAIHGSRSRNADWIR